MKRFKVKNGPHRISKLVKNYNEDYDCVWGVYVGEGCVTGEDPLEWRNEDAHAHIRGPWSGWICIADPYDVVTVNKNPTHLLLHEIAHLLCKSASHGKVWKETVSALGATKEATRY